MFLMDYCVELAGASFQVANEGVNCVLVEEKQKGYDCCLWVLFGTMQQ